MTIILSGHPDPDRYRVVERPTGSATTLQAHEAFATPALAADYIERMLATAPDQYAGHDLVVVDRRSHR